MIAKSRARETSLPYSERHHIIPKCMGGGKDRFKIAVLTPEEHFLAHKLLVKIYPQDGKLKFALHAMTISNKYTRRANNKIYGKMKVELALEISRLHKNKIVSDESKRKMSVAKSKKRGPLSEEHKEIMRQINIGRKHTQETIVKLQGFRKGRMHGDENYHSKEMTVTSPDGEVFKIKGSLQSFCIEHGFAYASLNKSLKCKRPLKSGKAQGWKAEYGW